MLRERFQEKEVKLFMIVALIIGTVMSFLICAWQTPDETTHLYLIGYHTDNISFSQKLIDSLGMDCGRIEWDGSASIDYEQLKTAMVKKPDYTVSEMLPKGFHLPLLRFLPGFLGIELGILLHLPTFWVLQLGELFSLFLYVFVCACGLKVCPFKKGIMVLFMLAPMMLQGAGSISADAIVVPFIYWIICYVFYLRFEKEEITTWDILKLLGAWLIITYMKLPYTFLILLGLMLPVKKYHLRFGRFEIEESFIKRVRIPFFIILSLGIVFGVYIYRYNPWVQVMYGVVVEWKRTIHLLDATVKTFSDHLLISSVGNFGWLQAPVAKWFAILFYVILFGYSLLGTDGSKKKYSRWDRAVIWITLLVLTLITVFSMVNHTIMITLFGSEQASETYDIRQALYMIPYIGGLQGRYFVPFFSLFFMQFGSLELINEKDTRVIFATFLGTVYVYVGYILIQRFWI